MASNKVPLGIFWDIENCPVPSGLKSSAVAKQLRDFLGDRHPECVWAEVACACDVTRMDQKVIAGLNANVNVVAHVTSTAKNAADDKLKYLIDMFIEKNADKDRVVLCLVTGDVNFADSVHKARGKNFDFVLIHGVSHSQDLKNLVKESYLFNDIIGIPKPADKTDAAHLTVTNLPTDKPMAKIHQRLSNLSSNCGGKPENKGDRTVINFGCKDDALRCLQRINGADVYGNPIAVTLGDPKPSRRQQKKFQQKENNGTAPDKPSPQLGANPNCQSVLKGVHTKANADPTQEADDTTGPSVPVFPLPPRVNNGCKSIIYGLESKPGQNMAKIVRKIVINWNEKCIHGNYIVSVDREPEDMQLDAGKYPLVVVARSPQMSDALVTSAQKHLKPNENIVWVAMIPKPTPSGHDSGLIAEDVASDGDYVSSEHSLVTSGAVPSPKPKSIYLQDKEKIVSTVDDLAIEAQKEPIAVNPINQEVVRDSTPSMTTYTQNHTSYPYSASDPKPIATSYPSPVPNPASSQGLLGKLISAFSVSKPTPVSTDYPLPTGLKTGQVIRINGRPKPFAEDFSIDFYRMSVIALHFSVRFTQGIVVRNSQLNGCWAQEERDCPYFPFQSRDAFEVQISVERNQYVIAVNGQPFCTFGHRMGYVSFNKLSFTGDLVVDRVHFE